MEETGLKRRGDSLKEEETGDRREEPRMEKQEAVKKGGKTVRLWRAEN